MNLRGWTIISPCREEVQIETLGPGGEGKEFRKLQFAALLSFLQAQAGFENAPSKFLTPPPPPIKIVPTGAGMMTSEAKPVR